MVYRTVALLCVDALAFEVVGQDTDQLLRFAVASIEVQFYGTGQIPSNKVAIFSSFTSSPLMMNPRDVTPFVKGQGLFISTFETADFNVLAHLPIVVLLRSTNIREFTGEETL